MLFKDLPKKAYYTVNGSITNFIVHWVIDWNDDPEERFQAWFEGKFVKGEYEKMYIYYPFGEDELIDLDEELVEDLKKVFFTRIQNRFKKLKEWDANRIEKQKGEPATEKQLGYATKLFFDLNEEYKDFLDREYSKREMIEIIGKLKDDIADKITKIKDEKYGAFKLINFSDYAKGK